MCALGSVIVSFVISGIIPWGIRVHILPAWVLNTYLLATAICAMGWEIWVTYGLAGGWRLLSREPERYPVWGCESLNWVVMASLDSACIHVLMMGTALMVCSPYWNPVIFSHWRSDVLLVFFAVALVQATIVAALHRKIDAKSLDSHPLVGKYVSWMPLSLTLPLSCDPVIDRPVILREMTYRIVMPWFAMPVIWNAYLIYGVFDREVKLQSIVIITVTLLVFLCMSVYMVMFVRLFKNGDDPNPVKICDVLWGVLTGSVVVGGWIYINQTLAKMLLPETSNSYQYQ